MTLFHEPLPPPFPNTVISLFLTLGPRTFLSHYLWSVNQIPDPVFYLPFIYPGRSFISGVSLVELGTVNWFHQRIIITSTVERSSFTIWGRPSSTVVRSEFKQYIKKVWTLDYKLQNLQVFYYTCFEFSLFSFMFVWGGVSRVLSVSLSV